MIDRMIAKRKQLGMSQAALGKALGTSQEMISMVEAGRKLLPKELSAFVARWLRTGKLPTPDELKARKQSNPGR
jgi:transcriptional regulator with XRE-family HTH domain